MRRFATKGNFREVPAGYLVIVGPILLYLAIYGHIYDHIWTCMAIYMLEPTEPRHLHELELYKSNRTNRTEASLDFQTESIVEVHNIQEMRIFSKMLLF